MIKIGDTVKIKDKINLNNYSTYLNINNRMRNTFLCFIQESRIFKSTFKVIGKDDNMIFLDRGHIIMNKEDLEIVNKENKYYHINYEGDEK